MRDAPKRRWFRFSLRTMFVAITVFACCLGWNLHVVQNRLAVRRLIVEHGGTVFVKRGTMRTAVDADGTPVLTPLLYDIHGPKQQKPIPLIRWLLGDDFVDSIWVPRDGACGMTNTEIEQMFPEAKGVFPDWRQELRTRGISIEEDGP